MRRDRVTSDDLAEAAEIAVSFVVPFVRDGGWNPQPVAELEWSSRMVADHICNTLAFYSNHAAVEAADHRPRIRSLGDNGLSDEDLAMSIHAWARILGLVLNSKSDAFRAWHPLGMADIEGFYALACNELLIHADDIGRAHGQRLRPNHDRCRRLLTRLFPDSAIAAADDPWQMLLWSNGRPTGVARPRQSKWRSHPAPID